jgi:cytosine deaminase
MGADDVDERRRYCVHESSEQSSLSWPKAGPVLDLLLRRVSLPTRPGETDVAVEGGRIVAVEPSPGSPRPATTTVDGSGRFLLPGLVDSHIHLEKAFLLDRMPREAETLGEAIALTAGLKPGFTREDIRARSIRVIERAVVHGVSHLRCQVEVDDVLGLLAMTTVLELKEEYAARISLEVVVFPQEGIFTQERGAELMREALLLGADVVGGIPYNDRDAGEHLDFVFSLAEEHGSPLDFHIDLSDDPQQLDILEVIERTERLSMQGRVAVGHLTSLGSVPRDRAREIARSLARAGISVMALPATDVYLNGRADEERPRRGMTPVRLLLDEGVNVVFATNNIQNAFTPFGRGNILDIARLLAEVCQFGTGADATTVVEMMTTRAARAMGLRDYGLEVGSQADFALFGGTTAREVFLEASHPDAVYKKGLLVAEDGVLL